MEETLTRRKLIKTTFAGGALGTFLLGNKLIANIADACGLTPPQTEGPFYPVKLPAEKDNDLTFVNGKPGKAKGQIVIIQGTIQDDKCAPVEKALVEVWQACESGRYNHPGDTSGLELDPNFQYYGRAVTDKNGNYEFKTILPGHYPAGGNWFRPPHIHFKVFARGYHDLTSQLYFSGKSVGGKLGELIDDLNRKDLILEQVPASERDRVIVEIPEVMGVRRGRFDITMRRV